ncbi:Non-canonical non-ribosomal peptide synthetase FUB8 [Pseudocercospora fuligena]|uniref:Non-canonical non-ribosomal peptide synthetase FUB8 n=1 Tax=Pseudocercospora fuligena TaxID=685502 RepID=A0A8H6RIJ9_9PEZI|nr:Non-canonical non-ribosomal peptide synthetase FUB8 [Pseudocercospora fuligena]
MAGSYLEAHATEIDSEVKSLPTVVEELARECPNTTWMRVPKDAELTQGWRDITYQELAHAVNGMARWVGRVFGIGRRSTDIAAYIGINDTRYAVAQVGLIKAGYMALLPSTRNSQEGQANLFSTTKCNYLLYSAGVDSQVETIKKAVPGLHAVQIPSFDELVEQGSKPASPYPGAYSNKPNDRVVVLHTSGSTGLPKPIYHTNASIYVTRQLGRHPAPSGRRNVQDALFERDALLFAMAPMFHMMGTVVVWRTILCRAPLTYIPPEKPPTPDLIIKTLNQTGAKYSLTPPSMLEEIVEAPSGLDALTKLDLVFYGGGPLADGTGDKVNEVSRVVAVIGSTEAHLIVARIPEDKHDWKYFEWAPGAGAYMEPDAGGLFEMTIRPADERVQAIFKTFSDIKEWRTKDLFEQHPRKKGLWLYKGRKDDVLVLSNGEKFNPVGFEKLLESHALVKGALVVGQGRFQTGLLIEPEWSLAKDIDPVDLVDQLWPLIEQANTASPQHGRVWKSKVAVAQREKPFRRTPKGSIVRQQTNALYESEIEALYSNESSDDELGILSKDADLASTKEWIRKAFKAKGFEIPDDAPDDADIFNYGMDSLQVMALSSTLSHASGNTVSPRVIYSNPTIAGLAGYLAGGETDAQQPSREDVMDRMVRKYTHDLSSKQVGGNSQRPQLHTVILTGSTGSLGNHILQELLDDPSIAHIYCLNRSADAASRQQKSFEARGIKADFSKVTFLAANFGQERFGLDVNIYNDLLQFVDIFVHNAWAVDFNKTLQTYEDVHVAGTRRAVDFSLQSRYNAQIVFVSSIASVGNWFATHSEDTAVPERIADSHSVALPQGYGESKHVAAMILAAAAEKAGVPVTIVRAGQLAGSAESIAEWNRHEWLPSIILSSKALGILPKTLGNQDTVDWVPMDLAAKSVVELAAARSKQSEKLAITHLVNPRTVSWSSLVPTVKTSLEQERGEAVKVVSFKEWLQALSSSPRTPEEIEKKPGLKIIDFYEALQTEGSGLPPMSTSQTQKLSKTVAQMKPIDSTLMAKWLKEWQQ